MQREQLREMLLAKRSELTRRVDGIRNDLSNRQISKQFDQQVVQQENDDVLAALDAEARQELREIDQALERIDRDTFGQCAGCGEDINDERLAALPYTRYCLDCAANRESR